MPNYAQITLIGHLGKDAEIKFTPTGTPVTMFSLAVTEKYKENKSTSWFKITLFSDKLTQYLTKGKPVMIIGVPKMETWEKDGQKHAALKIIADKIVFLGDGTGQRQSQQEQIDSEDVPF